MKSVAVILFLACACSGQVINSWGLNGVGLNGLAINGLGVRTLGINNLGLNGVPLAYNTLPMAAPAPIVAAAPIAMAAPMIHKSQYHAQNELGEASFGYSHRGQASATYQDPFGNQIGSYAYINPKGKEVKVSYVADALGFRVLSNDLPVAPVALPVPPVMLPTPVMDTPAVVEAKIAHMEAVEAARAGIVRTDLPVPVEDTEEVKAAKAEHAEAKAKIIEESKDEEVKVEEVKVEETKDRKKRQILGGLWGRGLGMIGGTPIVRSDVAISAPMTRDAVLTQIVHNPGHAMSYRVD